jgi:hypothetical protein|tara:strand:- start:926 stop:1123 length:198 start_codon:yes stop_codon:yes gene_type:complete
MESLFTTFSDEMDHMNALLKEIKILEAKAAEHDHDMGHIYTTINTLKGRVGNIQADMVDQMRGRV